VLADLADLATRAAGDAEWAALLERSRVHSVEQEPIEVLELRGLSLRRAGREGEARDALRAARALCERIPNVMRARVEASLAGELPERAGPPGGA
jgi:Flp pilus assembly protein TadD